MNERDDATIAERTDPGLEFVALDVSEGDWIGRYRLGRKLGVGGMGTVYQAEQREPLRRAVAAKIIQLGLDTQAMLGRFEAERQILALLDHPNVATILDAGSTGDGRPYFIMELVAGTRIDRYADGAQLAIRERIELFLQVLAGVEHAHQKGIIHRDLKPSNLLVADRSGEPVVKIIDFGIAKSLAPAAAGDGTLTRAGDFVGTPRYMSPEQAMLDSSQLDVRTDVFSLGVVLYELLVGLPPFAESSSSPADATRQTGRRSAEHPSKRLRSGSDRLGDILRTRRLSAESLKRVFSGDLSNILLKATEADRERRYRNVAEFSDDLHRYLGGYPVLARPRSVLYTAGKFARRHKGLIAATGLALAAMVGLAALAAVEYVRAERNAAAAREAALEARALQRVAEREARTARRVSAFLVDVFQTAAPGERADADITVREALLRSLPEIEGSLTAEPEVRTRVLLAVADALASLGQMDDARPLFTDALATARGLGDDALLHETLLAAGHAEKSAFRHEVAEALFAEALAMQRSTGARDTGLAEALHGLASAYLGQGRNPEAVPLLDEALSIWEVAAPDSEGHLESLGSMAVAWNDHRLNRRTGRDYLREVAAMHERRYGSDHHRTAGAYRNLASAELLLGPLDAALEHSGRALDVFSATVGDAHTDSKLTRNWRGRIHLSLGDFEAAARAAEAVLAVVADPVGDPDHHWALHNKALAALGSGDPEAVLALLEAVDLGQLGGLQRREATMAQAFSLTMLGRRGEGIQRLETLGRELTRLHRAEVLWAQAMIHPEARARLCGEGVALLADPRARISERSELLVYGQHARLRRCVGELEQAADLEAFLADAGYVDLFALAAARLPGA